MEKKLLEVIKANLPETVAGEMKEFILQAEQTKKDLKKSKENNSNLEDDIIKLSKNIDLKNQEVTSLNSRITCLNDQIKMCENCEERYLQLDYKERIMNIQNQHSVERVNDAKEFVSLAFKSPVFKKEVATTKTIPVKMAGYVDCNNQSVDGGETTEICTDTETTIKTEE